jgi:tRNA pseudouridine55 synthase
MLGCFGHVTALRRTRVGPFTEADATPLALLEQVRRDGTDPTELMSPVDRALGEIPAINVSRNDAGRMARGQSCLLRGAGAPIEEEAVAVFCQGQLIAIGQVIHGELHPRRVFHLGGG